MQCCGGRGRLHHVPWLSFSALIASRLILGVGESLGSTGSTLWGITSAGQESTAKVISYNGISTYGAMALGAPLGVILDGQWGLASIGLLTIVIGAISLVLAYRKPPVPVVHGEHLPFSHVLGRVAPHGMGLALGGICYSVLATFITLFYASRNWDGAALCLTAFGVGFIVARLLFIQTINRFGGFPVAMVCLAGGVAGPVSAVAVALALDGYRRFGSGRIRLLAGLSRHRRRGRQARHRAQSRHRAGRLHRLFRRLLLPHRPAGRRGHRRLRLRQRLSLRIDQRSCRTRNRHRAASDCRATR